MRESEGFSIVEVVIAMFLLMVLALAVGARNVGAPPGGGSHPGRVAPPTHAHPRPPRTNPPTPPCRDALGWGTARAACGGGAASV